MNHSANKLFKFTRPLVLLMNRKSPSVLLGFLLLASVLSLAPASAQLACVEAGTWATDEAGDGYVTGALVEISEGSDLLSMAIRETGATCGDLEVTVTVSGGSIPQVNLDNLDGDVVFTVDFTEADGAPDFVLEASVWADTLLGWSTDSVQAISLTKDGVDVAGGVSSSSYVDGVFSAVLPKSAFGSLDTFTGALATTEASLGGLLGGPLYTVDTMSTTTPYVFGVGFDEGGAGDADADNDGLPDSWEETYFGNTTNQTGSDDPDGDGLNNTQEYELGTDPTVADSDGDGLNDGNETERGTDPLDDDSDDDGITDGDEVANGTDPLDANDPGDGNNTGNQTDPNDTDGDGLNDQWEQDNFGNLNQTGTDDPDGDGLTNEEEETNMTDPNVADSDGDGFNDGDEVAAGSDPNNADDVPADSDGDGLDDQWERDNFGDLNQTATDDPDGDGLTNAQEEDKGTDPNNADTDGDGLNDAVDVDPLVANNDSTGDEDELDVEYLPWVGLAFLVVLILGFIGVFGRWAA